MYSVYKISPFDQLSFLIVLIFWVYVLEYFS